MGKNPPVAHHNKTQQRNNCVHIPLWYIVYICISFYNVAVSLYRTGCVDNAKVDVGFIGNQRQTARLFAELLYKAKDRHRG